MLLSHRRLLNLHLVLMQNTYPIVSKFGNRHIHDRLLAQHKPPQQYDIRSKRTKRATADLQIIEPSLTQHSYLPGCLHDPNTAAKSAYSIKRPAEGPSLPLHPLRPYRKLSCLMALYRPLRWLPSTCLRSQARLAMAFTCGRRWCWSPRAYGACRRASRLSRPCPWARTAPGALLGCPWCWRPHPAQCAAAPHLQPSAVRVSERAKA